MKRWKTVVLCVLVVFLAALVVGCSTSSSTYEFEGTWSALGLETWQFGSTSGSLSVNFIVNYTINFTYTAVDEKAKLDLPRFRGHPFTLRTASANPVRTRPA